MENGGGRKGEGEEGWERKAVGSSYTTISPKIDKERSLLTVGNFFMDNDLIRSPWEPSVGMETPKVGREGTF